MTARQEQETRFWLTAKGCEAAGGHSPSSAGVCRACGSLLLAEAAREDR